MDLHTHGRPMLPNNQKVFSSIFPERRNVSSPPRTYKQADRAQIRHEVSEALLKDVREALGTGSESFILNKSHGSEAFASHFFTCPSMAKISSPSVQQQVQFIRQIRKLSFNSHMIRWVQTIGVSTMHKVLARVVDQALNDFVTWAYAGTYNEEVRQHLEYWTKHLLLPCIKTVLCAISNPDFKPEDVPVASETEIEKYQATAMTRLWAMRAVELFDMVIDWDETVAGIDDLKVLLNTAEARQYVADRFVLALQKRLLHPGVTTVQILQIYVAIIRTFRRLDPRGVLLSKVSGRVRQYLREREDTIKVVVGGLLSDVRDASSAQEAQQMNVEALGELAWELQHRDPDSTRGFGSLDWNNMDWLPEPVDAAPESLRSGKHTDVIGSVISLFESKDVFVKELQVTLAERLLQVRDEYDQETTVLEHLKQRFGDAGLQACEVMLRDVMDSRRLDETIRRDQGLNADDLMTDDDSEEPEVHAKVLSAFFWPALPGATPAYGEEDKQFKPPLAILHQRNLYEQGFENLKQTRKLTWNDNVGQVEVEITFSDGRTYTDSVLPYQAGVLYAFNDDSETESSEAVSKSVAELAEELQLATSLARSACLLFVSKRVLTPHASKPDTYIVLEHLPPPAGTTAAVDLDSNQQTAPLESAVEADAAVATAAATQAQNERAAEIAAQQAVKEAEAKEKRAKMVVYQQFITAMLTNQGAMPLPRIAMMLGMVVPGGFPYHNEELREFLATMMREGIIELNGSNYKKA